MDAEKVLELENRSFLRIFYDYLLIKHIWFHTFIFSSISHPFHIRISLFFFGLSNSFCVNAIFFSDDYINLRNTEKSTVLINVKYITIPYYTLLYLIQYYSFNLFNLFTIYIF